MNPNASAAVSIVAVLLAGGAALSLLRPAPAQNADKFEALRRDPASPYAWCDLAESLQERGQTEKARYCFEQAQLRAPNLPPVWLRSMFFDFQSDRTAAALESSARVLRLVPDYDGVIFHYYDRQVSSVAQVLPYLAGNSRAAQGYFRHLLQSGAPEDVSLAWSWLRAQSLAQDSLAAAYLDFLLQHHQSGQAVQVWASYLGPHRGDYPDSNLVFNGDFQIPPTGAPLDWKIAAVSGAAANRDSHGLHILFPGTENVAYSHSSQTVCVHPGEYRFQASVRTSDLTTDEGIRFHLFDPESPARLDIYTDQLTGTSNWTEITKTLTIPSATALLVVEVCRKSSWKSNNKIGGEVWITAVSLKRLLP